MTRIGGGPLDRRSARTRLRRPGCGPLNNAATASRDRYDDDTPFRH